MMNNFDCTPEHMRLFGRTIPIAGALFLGESGSGVEFDTDAGQVRAQILGISFELSGVYAAQLGVFVTEYGDDGQPVTEKEPERTEENGNGEGSEPEGRKEHGENEGEENGEVVHHAPIRIQPCPKGPYEAAKKIPVRRDVHTYEIVSNPEHKHLRVRIEKLTESQYDKVALSVLEADAPLYPTPEYGRQILFIGDSQCAGYGAARNFDPNENPATYQFSTVDEDVTKSYAWQSAAILGAQGEYFCESGGGLISRWIPPETDIPDTNDLMLSLFPYVDKNTEKAAKLYLRSHGWKQPLGDYEYTTLQRRYEKEPGVTPFLAQLVVIYLGTNDVSFTRGISVREQHFVRRYIDLINDVRKFYTGARVLVLYGMMDQQLMEACRYAAGYTGSDFLELPLMNPAEEGIGCGQHPSPLTHRLAAEKIADYAGAVLGWERYASPAFPDADRYFLD